MNWKKVASYLKTHCNNHSRAYYYTVRNSNPRSIFSLAGKLIYLNRASWNGLFRVNLNGDFNVPFGSKTKISSGIEDLKMAAKSLTKANILAADFETVIDQATEGDFVFADPPYTVAHDKNGFVKYNETLFQWDDQIRLRDALVRAKKRGVTTVTTNAFHDSIKRLYEKDFILEKIERRSTIAGKNESRGKCKEFLIFSKN